jgi:hypothetical protein
VNISEYKKCPYNQEIPDKPTVEVKADPISINMNYANQEALVTSLAKKTLTAYEIPDALKAATCIFTQFFKDKTRLFNDNPVIYTRCQEKFLKYDIFVGGFSSEGLCIDIDLNGDAACKGVAALQKFDQVE